jgi:hypothetical protein
LKLHFFSLALAAAMQYTFAVVDVMITIFCDFVPILGKITRFSQKPIL